VKESRRRWNGIPACVREELGIRARAFYSYRVSSHGPTRHLGTRYLGGELGFGKAVR